VINAEPMSSLVRNDRMTVLPFEGRDALSRLRAFLAQSGLGHGERLPPERHLAAQLGLTRAELRKALASLQTEGQLWRHVGRGTFIGSPPPEAAGDIAAMARRTNPAEIMRARLLIEPEIARMAALNATPAQLEEMRQIMLKSEAAANWRVYESWDTRLHRLIAEATQNSLLVGLLDTLNAVRRMATWGRLRINPVKPARDHHSFAEHGTIVAAIANRDLSAAAQAMRVHLESVERNLLASQQQD
jgi:DNA-binding FadR family transcriptional regulator